MHQWNLFLVFLCIYHSHCLRQFEDEIGSKRISRDSEDFEETLRRMRDSLKEAEDEEHGYLTESDDTHAREWTLQLSSDDDDLARGLAKKYGFDHVSRIGKGHGLYRFKKYDSPSSHQSPEEPAKLKEDVDPEKVLSKRDHIEVANHLASDDLIMWYRRERILHREKRAPISKDNDYQQSIQMNDPKFHKEWYIKNDGQTTGPKGFDGGVEDAWNLGYTGKGVVVSVLDDGMDHTHPELVKNYDSKASTDLNGDDDDPFPNDSDPYNAHGTKCAGTIAAQANNSICGVGIAYDSNIGAIRMLDGKATDGLEADALSYHRNYIDIYSCSWGPRDNGATFGRPGNLGRFALEKGALEGRNGAGSIFIWATGNGGMKADDCNADGYVNSIYTLGIGAVNEHSVSTYYGEKCSAMFAVTYCSGPHSNLEFRDSKAHVITTYLHHQCTEHFVGTSSAAPLAAGIFALVLEANPKLTWRDVQHLVYQTAKQTSPMDIDWKKNGCGRLFNHKFGFGVLHAGLLVNTALNWTLVPKQRSCHFKLKFKNGDIPSGRHFKLSFKTDGCQSCKKQEADGRCKNSITKLEHVLVNVTLKHRKRGDLSIELISPSGTLSRLLHPRPSDCSSKGLKGWTFMTIFNWCENPKGKWQIIFKDKDKPVKTQDYEEEYVEKLDEEKKKEMEKRHDKINDDASSIDAVSEKREYGDGSTQDVAYEKRSSETYPRYANDDGKQSEYHNYVEKPRDYSDYLYRRLYSRHRRNTEYKRDDTTDTTDYVLYKKAMLPDYSICKESDLDKSLIAGQVLDISVTFYGT